MAPSLKAFTGQLKEVFDRFTINQKVSLIALSMVTVLAILALLIWANRPQYTILFSDLSSTDAARIRDQLQDEKVSYRLRNGGSTILVPRARLYDLRLQLAASGIPSQPGAGYEIFDRTNLGMSDFVQKLNFRRALEGELGRTISSLAEVEQARVHVVIPEAALFREDEKETTASVVLKLKGRVRPREDQIRGITVLVARSVEGLEPENITILDSYGNILAGMKAFDPLVGLSSTQLELQHKVESHLASKAQSMLDGVLGQGRSIVRVSSELDFQTIERTSEIYDPESAIVRSEERTESFSSGGGTTQSKEENLLSNYEINKTVEHIIDSGGSILQLSVAVMIDGTYRSGEDGTVEYTPRSEEETASLANMVRGALGIREERGDVLEISNIAFNKEMFTQVSESWAATEYKELAVAVLPKVILGTVLLILIFMIRGFLRRQQNIANHIFAKEKILIPAGEGPAQLMPATYTSTDMAAATPGSIVAGKKPPPKVELPPLESEIPEEVRTAKAKREQIIEFTTEKPEIAAGLLRSWIAADS